MRWTWCALAVALTMATSLSALAQDEPDDHGDMASPAATADASLPEKESMAGHDMGPIDPQNAREVAANAQGNQLLEPTIIDGVKEFQLTTSVIRWNILPDVQVTAYAYNEQVPGPLLRVTAGDRVRLQVLNDLPEPTSIHWHGLVLPNDQDGVAGVTQTAIAPGTSFTYDYTVPDRPGTYFYHTHVAADRQQALGLYGALIIDPRDAPIALPYDLEVIVELGEWRITDGQTIPAMELEGALPNYFTINGKSSPETQTVRMRVGETLLVRFIGTGQFIHPMHIHGGPFRIVATDSNPVPEVAQLMKDTVLIGPGERYDVLWEAREPGKWLLHCHINHHITNNGAEVAGGGGLTMVIEVQPGTDAVQP